MTTTQNLPTLTGSAKQILWANDVRLEFVRRVQNSSEFTDCDMVLDFYAIGLIAAANDVLMSQVSAQAWIDNRMTPERMLPRRIYLEVFC